MMDESCFYCVFILSRSRCSRLVDVCRIDKDEGQGRLGMVSLFCLSPFSSLAEAFLLAGWINCVVLRTVYTHTATGLYA